MCGQVCGKSWILYLENLFLNFGISVSGPAT